MSTTPLSTVQETIERTIYDRIIKELIDKGYSPDIYNTTLFPVGPTGVANFQTALLAIKNTKGFAVEVFNHSSEFAKGTQKVPRIVIKSQNGIPGAIGGDPSTDYLDMGSYYQAQVLPPQTTDYFLDVRLIAATVAQDRILQAIVALALPKRGYIPIYNDSTRNFFIRYINYYDDEDLPQGLLQKVYGYEIPDAWETEPQVLPDPIAKMTDITLEIHQGDTNATLTTFKP
jgi:hypothetical protein